MKQMPVTLLTPAQCELVRDRNEIFLFSLNELFFSAVTQLWAVTFVYPLHVRGLHVSGIPRVSAAPSVRSVYI